MLIGIDRDVGRIIVPALSTLISLPGRAVKPLINLREIGIFSYKIRRPVYGNDGQILRYCTVAAWTSHNERVDAGASLQARQVFGGGSSPGAPSATAYAGVAIAIANANFTKTKTDQSIGSATAGVTTNEFTGSGLARAAATAPVGGDYTAPSTLGGTFAQVLAKQFTATASVTAWGAALFTSVTPAGSVLYSEDLFTEGSTALVNNDQITARITISN